MEENSLGKTHHFSLSYQPTQRKNFSPRTNCAITALILRCSARFSFLTKFSHFPVNFPDNSRKTEQLKIFSPTPAKRVLFSHHLFLYLFLRFSHFPLRMMTLYAIWILNVQFMIRTTDNINLPQRIRDFLEKSFYLRWNFSIWSFPSNRLVILLILWLWIWIRQNLSFIMEVCEKRRLIKIETWNYLV